MDRQCVHQSGHIRHGYARHVQDVQVFKLLQSAGTCQHLGLAECHAATRIAQVDTRELGIATQAGERGLYIGRGVEHINAHYFAVAGQGLGSAGTHFVHLQAVAAIRDFGQGAGAGSHLCSCQFQRGG